MRSTRVGVGLVVSAFLLAGVVLGCTRADTVAKKPLPELTAGERFIDVPGGKVWVEIVGSGAATPLLLLHGGPGAPSNYLDPLRALADERPVIFYDQLGCGRSDRPDDPSLWTMERFVEELAAVRDALGLERFHLLGHSWGSTLAVDYLLTKKPEGVGGLILAGPALSMPRFEEDTARLVKTLSPESQEAIERGQREGTTDSEEYQQANAEFMSRYLCRLDPPPPELEATLAGMGQEVYGAMWGPSEFQATGSLKDVDLSDRLSEITQPTLLTAGRYDEATPETAAWYQSLIPGARLVIFENSAHMTMLEEPELYAQTIRDFLEDVESESL